MKEYEHFERVGVEPHRSYYIPFAETDTIKKRYGIVDRFSSSKFLSLNGIWEIKQHQNIEQAVINEDLQETIPVPSCVQMHGYDYMQYVDWRYPFPFAFPHTPYENPCWHYRRKFTLAKSSEEKYYLNFEGVDSAFYLYINGVYKGYSQISHATSEFDVTDLLQSGENQIDVLVLKWCVSSYLECQDKFRFSGIFRSVYLLTRPQKHIRDYRIVTCLSDADGVLTFENESEVGIRLVFGKQTAFVKAGKKVEFCVKNVKKWTAENPFLYPLYLYAEGEKILEYIGFRQITIENGVFQINGKAIKLKGINRHDFSAKTGATISLKEMFLDIRLIKELNANAVRSSHYPNPPEFYQLCDRYGLYVMSEADLEMHGGAGTEGGYSMALINALAENMAISDGILDREKALVEREKNRPSIIMWSLANESGFGKAFFAGAKYIKQRDKTRPVQYQGVEDLCEKYYYSPLIDVIGAFYPTEEKLEKKLLNNKREKRPFILTEYAHSMGNSDGDISAYWEIINKTPQMLGGFAWQLTDHAIRTKKGLLYGGDFGETEHDGNFCCTGLYTIDRKIKSGGLELQALYGGKTKPEVAPVAIPPIQRTETTPQIVVCKHTGELLSLKVGEKEILHTPMRLNITRYIDNDYWLETETWTPKYNLKGCKPLITEYEEKENGYSFKGYMATTHRKPALSFHLTYQVEKGALRIETEYEIADYIQTLPRFGLEFGIDKKHSAFSYIGYGPYESYVDKYLACDYGFYENDAYGNYYKNYVRPQESGSHYHSKYMSITNLFAVTAEKPFSFSVNPYTTAQLRDTKHQFELKENDFVNVCLDVAMRGIGTCACGPKLSEKYELKKKGSNVFVLTF